MILRFNIILLLILQSFLPHTIFANSYSSINYVISKPQAQSPVIKIEAEIIGTLSKELVLDLPYKWASANYMDQIKNIKLIDLNSKFLINKKNSHQLIITLPKKTNSVKVSYEIHQKPGNPSDIHETIIRNNLVHSTGYGLFATPANIKEQDKLNFSVQWKELPDKWNSLSSYGTHNTLQFSTTAPLLLHSFYAAGNMRIYKIATKQKPVFLSLYGSFDINDKKIVSSLNEIIKTQRSFFNDSDFPYYAISMLEGDDPFSMGGTGLHNSFTAYLPKGMNYSDYYILFAHEHLHNWIGGKIATGQQEELNYWWSEGFTDYYSRILALRSGGISIEAFISEFNQFLRYYYLSPVLNEPNIRIQKDFWNDPDIEKLPYYRGFVFALYINNLIKQNDNRHSLDNVMLDLFQNEQHNEFSTESFKKIIKKYIANGIDKEISEFITIGKVIDLHNLASNLPLEKIKMGPYERGFERQALLEEKLIKNININSNAYKAGLRNGDIVLEWDFPKGMDQDQIVTVTTTKGIFQFRPEHSNKKDIYQFKSNLSSKDKLAIKRYFMQH